VRQSVRYRKPSVVLEGLVVDNDDVARAEARSSAAPPPAVTVETESRSPVTSGQRVDVLLLSQRGRADMATSRVVTAPTMTADWRPSGSTRAGSVRRGRTEPAVEQAVAIPVRWVSAVCHGFCMGSATAGCRGDGGSGLRIKPRGPCGTAPALVKTSIRQPENRSVGTSTRWFG